MCYQFDINAGKDGIQQLVNIHFKSPSLGQHIINSQHEAMLYFCFNIDVIGVVIAHDLTDGEFVAQIPYFPPQQSFSSFDDAVCRSLVFSLAGNTTFNDIEILDVQPWKM